MNSPLWFLLAMVIALVGGAFVIEGRRELAPKERTFECKLEPDSTPQHARFTCRETRAGRTPALHREKVST